jgi:anti-anti-sigma factor
MVKIDTKEKYHAITIQEPKFTAIMTEQVEASLLRILESNLKNVILDLKDILYMEDAAAGALIHLQQTFYEQGASFIVCNLQPRVREMLDLTGLLEIINEVPTPMEAADIIHMEEIERELLEDDQ